MDVALIRHAIANKLGDGEHLQVVHLAEFDQVGHTRHTAVFIHNFTDDAGRLEAGDAREVHTGFGLAGAHQDSAIASAQGKDVPGPREILRFSF